MYAKYRNCTRRHSCSLNDLSDSFTLLYLLCKKQGRIPISEVKTFKTNCDLSDARVNYTRLGFRFYGAVSPLTNYLLLSRYSAASPVLPDLPSSRFLAARLRTGLISHCFLSFQYLPTVTGLGFCYNCSSPIKYRFQQSSAANFISSQGRIKRDFSFTPSESITLSLPQQILIAGLDDHKIENNLSYISTPKGVQ